MVFGSGFTLGFAGAHLRSCEDDKSETFLFLSYSFASGTPGDSSYVERAQTCDHIERLKANLLEIPSAPNTFSSLSAHGKSIKGQR